MEYLIIYGVIALAGLLFALFLGRTGLSGALLIGVLWPLGLVLFWGILAGWTGMVLIRRARGE